jgi:glycosyltransferase involved in cell wall biosynthesis
MKVSVIIRAYNRGYIIAEAIDSALRQSYSDVEIVVVDDGSTDNTQEVVEGFRSGKIRYVRHQQNRGVGVACNTGIAASTGEAVALLDSDDLWAPDKLEKQMRLLATHPEVGAIFCDVKIQSAMEFIPSLARFAKAFPVPIRKLPAGAEYTFSLRQMYLCLLEDVPIKPSTILMRRDAVMQAGQFREVRSGEDWDFFLRLSRTSPFGYVDEVLATQRTLGDSVYNHYVDDDKIFLIARLAGEKATLQGDRQAVAAVNRGLGTLYKSLAGNYMIAGKRAKSFSTYLEGFMRSRKIELLLRAPVAFTPSGFRRLVKQAGSLAKIPRKMPSDSRTALR